MPTPTIILHTERTRGLEHIHAILKRLERGENNRLITAQAHTNIDAISTPHEVHWIRGIGKEPGQYSTVANLPNVYFLENGWFNPQHSFQIDTIGLNAGGSVPHSITPDSPNDMPGVLAFIERLHGVMNVANADAIVAGRRNYIFVPLQYEYDAQILHHSCCEARHGGRVIWAIDQICRQFPDHKIIIRPHPKVPKFVNTLRTRSKNLRRHSDVEITQIGNTYQWLKHARAVVGINSTVLTEALTFEKPVAALGEGIFSGNGVCLECWGNAERLREVLDYIPNGDRINQFITLLRTRQILYSTPARQLLRFPILKASIDMAYHCAQ